MQINDDDDDDDDKYLHPSLTCPSRFYQSLSVSVLSPSVFAELPLNPFQSHPRPSPSLIRQSIDTEYLLSCHSVDVTAEWLDMLARVTSECPINVAATDASARGTFRK